MKSPITTHILDTSKGTPAQGVAVELLFRNGETWESLANAKTDNDGRLLDWFSGDLKKGQYRLRFETGSYQKGFYPQVQIDFEVQNTKEHYHVPLLLNPFGYSTYRGS